MHSSEHSRRGQRRRPDLNINTSSTSGRGGRDSVPSTPPTRKPSVPAKGPPPVSSRGIRVPSSATPSHSTPNSEKSFLDNDSPVDPKDIDTELPRGKFMRDSHDLSLPARQFTRDSLVTNMLNSLDQFSLSQINTPLGNSFHDDDDHYGTSRGDYYTRSMTSAIRPGAMFSPGNGNGNGHGNGHSHGHGHGYSYSSDFDDSASKASDQFSRGRRSNSSSGFQSGLVRINSLRERSHPGASGMRALHSRGGKTSKSSSTNSIDTGGYAQVLNTQRWAHGIGGRSSSLDYGQRSVDSATSWRNEFSNTFLVDEYEAAPTPTIPGGPRKTAQPPASPVPPPPPPPDLEPKTPDRKKSAKSRSGTSKSTPARYNGARDVPPLPPTPDIDSAPAPHIGYEKSKDAILENPVPAAQTKEKPGFFSRLFGTARSSTAPTEPSPAPAPSPGETTERTGTKSPHTASQMKAQSAQSAPPSRDDTHPPAPHHVIQKKSSFFRRRKKSVAEPPPPPPPPVPPVETLQPKEEVEGEPAREPSVSSLRQIMSPYLKNSAPPTPGALLSPRRGSAQASDSEPQDEETKRKTRGFSPEYEPGPSATIRTVKSTSALKSHSSFNAQRRGQVESPLRENLELPIKSANSCDTSTFFNDSSDEGESPKHISKRRSRLQQSSKSASASPMHQKSMASGDASNRESLGLPLEGRHGSVGNSDSRPALSRSASSLPSVKVDGADVSPKVPSDPFDEPEVSIGEPTEDDRQKAQRIYDGNEDFIQREKAASWMGEEGPVRQRTLQAYMDLYNFENLSVLAALRQICDRLVLRAETQQIDRILVAFSKRWCDCNPNHGFKSIDVIHTMCYSIMLLNTDLHLADIESKMTRSQFVKNTMTTVKAAIADTMPDAFDNRASILPGKNALLSPAESETTQSTEPELERPSWRASFKPLGRPESQLGFNTFNSAFNSAFNPMLNSEPHTPADACGPLVKAPFEGTMRAWEGQMEIVLKETYASIRDEKLPLFGADTNQSQNHLHQQSGLSVMGVLKRTPSVLSKAPSEGQVSSRGRMADPNRHYGPRWNSKSRSRPRFPGNGFSSSRTSFDDTNSTWSPTVSSATWSRNSLGRTQTSVSVDSFASGYPHGDYQQSIGFANALSQAIIREDIPLGSSAQSIMSEEIPSTQLLEDESLELLGAPWVKEGIVIHKHHLDGIEKKAKDRNWTEVFAVVQKGTLSLFSFSTKSMRQKGRVGRKPAAGAVVGGGNWQENATSLGSFSLKQTLASALPAPGYSRTRPNVWALSLPTGAVHLFQVGTPEISKEFVLTVNYWSARLSTHPLIGGISNIEYGWSDAVINNALVTAIHEASPPQPQRPSSAAAGRSSMHSRQGSRQSSIRSSFDVGTTNRTKLPGDRIHITDWTPPAQSMRASTSSEAEQLETLQAYVKSIEDDLQLHNQLRSPMLLAFTPRGQNSSKAMANWERKSSYLLREIVKFRTYVDCLQHAAARRNEIYTERNNARRAARGEDVHDDAASLNSEEADVTLKVT
ncbi:hypothetical protein F4775DRAFT_332997 [Biscogniauxia sp. FL1348]|nr:hypothetical protein F4775DRAFT_332997 [Biscogniauxia sp. FL1348]